MKRDVQFSPLSLMPVGQGFSAGDQKQNPANIADRKAIEQARIEFQRSAKKRGAKPERRKTRDEKAFVSKIGFILSHRDFTSFSDQQDVLLSLLADVSTLFSRSYQAYRTNHEFYRVLRLQHGKTKQEELQSCKDYALRRIPESDQKRRYEYILDRLEEKASLEGRPVSDLEYQLVLQVASSNEKLVINLGHASQNERAGFERFLRSRASGQFLYNIWRAFAYGVFSGQLCDILQKCFQYDSLHPQNI